eukprot:gene16971-21451_t
MGATITDIGPWYHGLAQPRWAPPDATYGMAWMAIYAFTALAGVNGWLAMPNAREREWLLGLFALNGFLNIVWSLLFFRLHRPDWAVIEALGLWLSVLALILRGGDAGALSAVGDVCRISQHDDRPSERTFRLNPMMIWLFASGHAVDVVLLVIACELIVLVTRARWRLYDALLCLTPGVLMLLALRAALIGLDWRWIAVLLLASFPVNLADL